MNRDREKGQNKRGKKADISPPFIARCTFIIVLFYLLIIPCTLLSALDFSLRPKGFVFIPLGSGSESADGQKLYGVGGGGDIGLDVDLSSIWPNPIGLGYTLGLEGGLLFNEVKSDDPKNLSVYSFGGGLGLYFFPMSRLFTRIDGAVGVFQPSFDGENGYTGLYLRGGGEVGFRFTPGFTLAANTGWRKFKSRGEVFNSGMYVGLTAQITFQTGRGASREGTTAALDQYEPVYPAFMQLYQTSPIGSIVIRNNENAEIRDVRVSFRASPYTASEFPCGTASVIQRGSSAELPLLADFSPDILRFTDNGRILGEVIIRYRFLGQEREAIRTVIVASHNRSTVTGGDMAALAAFISPTSPEILDYAKYISGLARANRRTGHNQNFQYAVWLLEGLRASGIRLGETYGADNEAQFPAETLSYGTGSGRDLALLFASGLEGVGIPSALIKTEDDFLAVFSLNIGQSAAETLFNGLGRILVIDDTVWVPLSMNAFNEGFTSAWARGAETLNRFFESGAEVDLVMVEEAWAIYPPAPLPEQGGRIVRTDTEAASRETNRAMTQYIEQELQPIISRIQTQINTNPTMALYNRLGIVQARTGRIAEAKTAYERAAGMGSVPAMTNRANLALTEQDFAAAERFFKQALSRESENKAALKGLEQIEERK